MPRTARKKSESGFYHIVLRGINKQTIFYDDEDKEVFLNRLKLVKDEKPFEIFAFCLMGNHIHLLVKELEISISKIMQKLLISYIFWYNRKYERIGNLFQDRYKSEVILNDSHLLCAARYIYQNPIKAGLVQKIDEYKWSSYEVYINDKKSFVDVNFILSILKNKEEYINFMSTNEEMKFLEFENLPSISDEKLLFLIERILKKFKIVNILSLEKEARNEVLLMIKAIPGASLRQISRVTGIPISLIRHIR